MSQNHPVKDPAILFVDDEAQALKYFARSFGDDFRILTINNADDAESLINSGTEHIGIVISDQRMPGRTGASLLSALRASHPQIVRLVTTAYSDLDSAIESVNGGEVLRYIIKPWDIDALKLDLQTAMRIYQLQKEREDLLAEKLSVQQNITAVDRLRTLIVACSGLKGYPHAAWSACRYGADIGRLDRRIKDPVPKPLDLWQQAEAETLYFREIVSRLTDMPTPPAQIDTDTSIATAWNDAQETLMAAGGASDLSLPAELKSATTRVARSWLADIFENSIKALHSLTTSLEVSAKTNGHSKTTITLFGDRQTDAELPVLYNETVDLQQGRLAALLQAYLMIGETSGAISLKEDAGKLRLAIEFDGQLACNEDKNVLSEIKQSFRSFERWPQ